MKRGAVKNEVRDEERSQTSMGEERASYRETQQKQPGRKIQLMWECEKKQERRDEGKGRMSVNEVGEV